MQILLQIRTQMGFSQSEMAKRLGISTALVCRVEKGQRKLSSTALILLAQLHQQIRERSAPSLSQKDQMALEQRLLQVTEYDHLTLRRLEDKLEKMERRYAQFRCRKEELEANLTGRLAPALLREQQHTLAILNKTLKKCGPVPQLDLLLQIKATEARLHTAQAFARTLPPRPIPSPILLGHLQE